MIQTDCRWSCMSDEMGRIRFRRLRKGQQRQMTKSIEIMK